MKSRTRLLRIDTATASTGQRSGESPADVISTILGSGIHPSHIIPTVDWSGWETATDGEAGLTRVYDSHYNVPPGSCLGQMDRREFLETTTIAGLAGLVGITAYNYADGNRPDANGTAEPPATTEESTTTSEEPVRHADAFETVIDVQEAGADPTGAEPIDELLLELATDDTLLSFRPGTYRLPRIELSSYDHLGIAAAHDERPTFLAPAHSCIDSDPHVQFTDVTDFLFEGIDFDFRRNGAGGAINVIASGDATVRDVTAQGSCRAQITTFRMDIRDPEGTGLVENYRATQTQNTGWLTGAYVGERHSGEVTFRNCELRGFTDNGLYGSAPGTEVGGGGSVHTEGCRFRNNNVSNIRLGTPGSTARGDSIVVESAPDAARTNLRGIRFRRGFDQVVEDCDIRFGPDVTNSFGAIVYHADNGGARLVNSRVRMHSDGVPAIKAFYPQGEQRGAIEVENVTITGGASRGYTCDIHGRNKTTFSDCTIEQTSDRRDGIRLAYCDDCELVDSRIEVSGYPLILRESTLRIQNTTFVTPDGEYHVDEMEAGPGEFRPNTWSNMTPVGE